MFISLVNDCHDANAFGRQTSRFASMLEVPVSTTAVSNDLEAAGNLIDLLDATQGELGAIVVNVAPRAGELANWENEGFKSENGSPFCYFRVNETLVVSTVAGLTLSLIRKLRIVDEVYLLDLAELARKIPEKLGWDEIKIDRLSKSQFRSFEFIPDIVRHLLGGGAVPSKPLSTVELPVAPRSIWWVDNFGNCKTTILPHEVNFEAGKDLTFRIGDFACYESLKDVPKDTKAAVIGSSGYSYYRFLELTIQGDNLAVQSNLHSGIKLMN